MYTVIYLRTIVKFRSIPLCSTELRNHYFLHRLYPTTQVVARASIITAASAVATAISNNI